MKKFKTPQDAQKGWLTAAYLGKTNAEAIE